MKLQELMEIASERDIKGYINSDKEFRFKTEGGLLFTWNKVLKEWAKPRITSYWFQHNFIVQSWRCINEKMSNMQR